MPKQNVPEPIIIYYLEKTGNDLRNPSENTKKEFLVAEALLQTFEEGIGDPEIVRQIDEELSERMPHYKELKESMTLASSTTNKERE